MCLKRKRMGVGDEEGMADGIDRGVLGGTSENEIMGCEGILEDLDYIEVKNIYRKSLYENNQVRYDGHWKDERYDGHGKSYYKNGQVEYDGHWKGGKRNGQGKKYSENGSLRYDGHWKDEQYDGEGKFYLEGGKLVYEGNWRNDERDGHGITYGYYEGCDDSPLIFDIFSENKPTNSK